MSGKINTNKGLKTEEVLRNYFLNMGYFVVRGIKFQHNGNDITDIDLWLYHKNSLLSRERINVDIKDKKSPKAAERLLWTKGIQDVLGLNNCIVATSDRNLYIRDFGQKYGITVLDGEFLSILKQREKPHRYTEEEFQNIITPSIPPKGIEDWYVRLQNVQTRLLTDLDFTGINNTLEDVKFFLEKILTNRNKQEVLIRCLYLTLSYVLILLDFIQQKTLFLEEKKRKDFFDHGFRYGELGKEGIERFIDIATVITRSPKKQITIPLFNLYKNMPVNILTEYFNRSDILKNLFKNAKEFESIAYYKDFRPISTLNKDLLSHIFIMADFFKIDRKKLPY